MVSMGETRIVFDNHSFVKHFGDGWVSEGLHSAIEQFCDEMDTKGSINDVTFKHVDYGENIKIYLRRDNGRYLVSLEDKDFSVGE